MQQRGVREVLDLEETPRDEKRRWTLNHNLSLDPMQADRRKSRHGTVYRQPFHVLTLQDRIKMKLASRNAAEKVERYTRATVLFSKFEADNNKYSPRMN